MNWWIIVFVSSFLKAPLTHEKIVSNWIKIIVRETVTTPLCNTYLLGYENSEYSTLPCFKKNSLLSVFLGAKVTIYDLSASLSHRTVSLATVIFALLRTGQDSDVPPLRYFLTLYQVLIATLVPQSMTHMV